MAKEIKNTFLKSKMNKDLDDRILPNGEYRDARNISVGRSEDNDVGALENIIGNDLVTGTDIGDGLTVIGIHTNNATDQIFVFLTDYTDPNTFQPTNAPSTSKHYIYVYNNSTQAYTKLVEGEFLNFSTTNNILGINLIESLLFWTDNRNQPRKINIGLANQAAGSRSIPTQYYTQEHQISVAKYNPYQSIKLYNRIDVEILGSTSVGYFDVSGDQVNKYTPFIGATVVSIENNISGDEFITVQSVSLNPATGDTRIAVSPDFNSAPSANTYMTLIQSTMSNKNSDATWPGDPDYLEDRFVRFSYRFKYDDNEYSLMAPFTQIAYIPKQNGFFLNGDEDAAYQSTIVNFMENQVQNIGLVIPLPTNANRIVRDYKISEVEILFRESDSVAVKVLESISAGKISGASGADNYYAYDYQSRKPYKTLPEAQTVRVYDKVPVRAFSQESSGNRIIYGNYRDQHTPPANINYNCKIAQKSDTGVFNNWIEYPNHSVKRNRNYQIGFVLADKFGRQSPVILSSVDSGIGDVPNFYSGSTIYSSYDASANDTNVLDWFGDAINVIVNSEITSEINLASGTPGLYAIKQAVSNPNAEGYAIQPSGSVIVNDTTSTFRLSAAVGNLNTNIPIIGNYMRGAYEDFVLVTNVELTNPVMSQYTVTTSGRVNNVYLRAENLASGAKDLKFAYTINDLGWYSYKVVVKQTEQEYYNVYLPGILNGYPGQSSGGEENGPFPSNETNLTAHTVLLNDNINKVPRDLEEVGPTQKQFRSSVELYGRVNNTMEGDAEGYNEQYYARLSSSGKNAIDHTVTTISTALDLDMAYDQLSNDSGAKPRNGNLVYYQIDSNPLIARISTTEKSIGATNINVSSTGAPFNMVPYLAVYETKPVESLLDIYWETTSEGLIVDLNADVLSSGGQATGFTDIDWNFTEASIANSVVTTNYFEPIDSEGQVYAIPATAELTSQINGNDEPVELFELEEGTGAFTGKYLIRFLGNNQVESLTFNDTSRNIDVYTIGIKVTTSTGDESNLTIGGVVGGEGALKNIAPSYTKIPDFRIPVNSTVVLPGFTEGAGKWAAANPLNGSANNNQNREGLQYTLVRGSATSNIPDNWEINRNNGQIAQTAGVNDLKTYTATIRVTDANGVTSPNGSGGQYNQLFVDHDTNISVDYPMVNSEAVSNSCIVDPVLSDSNIIRATTLNSASGIWYLKESDSETNPPVENISNTFNINVGSHTSGTLLFTSNVKQLANFGGNAEFKAAKTTFYYRKVGTTTWIQANRLLEYNQAGNALSTDAVNFDYPGGSGGLTIGSNATGYNWLSNIRAFDYSSFGFNGGGVEYAIVVENLKKESGTNTNYDVAGWVVADDLHYPKCIPWQGTNAAPATEGDSYEYFRSSEGEEVISSDPVNTGLKIYAETPYGEYVNKFYTDSGRTTVYTPPTNARYINFELNAANPLVNALWTTQGDNSQPPTGINLRWSAGFDSELGTKLFNTNSNYGVKAVQTSPLVPYIDPIGLSLFATSRIKITN